MGLGGVMAACGCIPGVRLCPEGERLYVAMCAAWDATEVAGYTLESWRAYEAARDAYQKHVGEALNG